MFFCQCLNKQNDFVRGKGEQFGPLTQPSTTPMLRETAASVSAALSLVNPTSSGLIAEADCLHVSDEFSQIDVSLEADSACYTSDQSGGNGRGRQG